ncbi:hypothetical protein D3C87_1801720 [compost metagenome]
MTAWIISITRSLWPWATSISTPWSSFTRPNLSTSPALTPIAITRGPGVADTISACAPASGMKRWITPKPPNRRISVAIVSSVTVSMLALMIGTSMVRSPTRRVVSDTSLRE